MGGGSNWGPTTSQFEFHLLFFLILIVFLLRSYLCYFRNLMHAKVVGNTKGLKPSEIRKLEKLAERKLDDEIVSLELARELYYVAEALSRRIGLLIDRGGRVTSVVVGDKKILYLPDLGRMRSSSGRLRQVRLVFSDLSNAPLPQIPHDNFADLEKLRLDAVISVKPGSGGRMQALVGYLVPEGSRADDGTSGLLAVDSLAALELVWDDFIQGVEQALESEASQGKGKIGSRVKNGAVLVGVYGKGHDPESSMAELRELAASAGVIVLDEIVQRRTPDPVTYIGKGKLEEIVLRCLRLDAELLIIDMELRPSQWRAVTNATELKILDRSMLILDIFSQRAKSSDGRLQVELAQLKYNLPRLVERDTGLSRLSGGIGGRGPGETKLEVSRRRARDRIAELEKQIERLSSTRAMRREVRLEGGVPSVAIVGYTNVGKSTLFNALTKSDVIVENKLFATLDTTQRRFSITCPSDETGMTRHDLTLGDTVGFIRDLPKELVNAFRATLEELSTASVLIVVLDASDPHIDNHNAAVEGLLSSLELTAKPRINLLNKIDVVTPEKIGELERMYDAIGLSAVKRIGFDTFKKALDLALFHGKEEILPAVRDAIDF